MRKARLYIVCNAMDDKTRLARRINTDSPAASRKVFLMAKALRACGARVSVVSWGRGRQDGSGRFFTSEVRRIHGVPVVYLAFLNVPILSGAVSLCAPIVFLWRRRRRHSAGLLIFYNRLTSYLPTLVTARLLRYRTVLDLEDGALEKRLGSSRGVATKLVNWLFDHLCKEGVLLACEALARQTRIRPAICYYGAVEQTPNLVNWRTPKIAVLLGGTVSRDTGALQLIDAIKILRTESPDWAREIQIEVTGRGDCVAALRLLSEERVEPYVEVHGRITDAQYTALVARSHVGLALKPPTGDLATSTFPSKVTEMACFGLIVITTDISDVRKVLGPNALYLAGDSPRELTQHLAWIAQNRDSAQAMADAGAQTIYQSLNSGTAGKRLLEFLTPILP